MQSHRLLFVAKVAILAAVYLSAARLGLLLAFMLGQNTFVWPPTGIALAKDRTRRILGVFFDRRPPRGGLWRECRQYGRSPVRCVFVAASRSLPDRPRTVTGCVWVAGTSR